MGIENKPTALLCRSLYQCMESRVRHTVSVELFGSKSIQIDLPNLNTSTCNAG